MAQTNLKNYLNHLSGSIKVNLSLSGFCSFDINYIKDNQKMEFKKYNHLEEEKKVSDFWIKKGSFKPKKITEPY